MRPPLDLNMQIKLADMPRFLLTERDVKSDTVLWNWAQTAHSNTSLDFATHNLTSLKCQNNPVIKVV